MGFTDGAVELHDDRIRFHEIYEFVQNLLGGTDIYTDIRAG
jgi:hypothetical protein